MPSQVRGIKNKWNLIELVGRGDAGEVTRVKSDFDSQTGVMKRPVQNASGGTIVRQAAQIEKEALILEELAGLNASRHGVNIHTPMLLDQSVQGTSNTANYFIVSEEVPGESLTSLLAQTYRGKSAISKELVLRVLAGTFQLLRQVHQKGVLWNDVKMDHIFWHQPTSTLSFIDWGNGLRFNLQDPDKTINPQTDYRQLFDEGRLLMDQTAPELISDLAWPEDANLISELEISQLQLRLEYLQEHISMHITEYNLMLQKQIRTMDSIEVLENTLDLMDSLTALGVPVTREEIITKASELLLQTLRVSDNSNALAIIDLLSSRLEIPLGSEWSLSEHLIRETHSLKTETLSSLISLIIQKDWVGAVWLLNLINNDQGIKDFNSLVEVMRSNSGFQGAKSETFYSQLKQLADSVHVRQLEFRLNHLNSIDAQQSALKKISNLLDEALKNWHDLGSGELLGDKFLLVREAISLILQTGFVAPAGLQQGLNTLLSKTREVYQAWSKGDLKECRQSMKAMYLVEPSLSYLLEIFDQIRDLENWISLLTSGPKSHETVNTFAKRLLSEQAPSKLYLGKVQWLENLLSAIKISYSAIEIGELRNLAEKHEWPLPWLNHPGLTLDLPYRLVLEQHLSDSDLQILEQFHQNLKNEYSNAEALSLIKKHLPGFLAVYSSLNTAFDDAFSGIITHKEKIDIKTFPTEDQHRVAEALEVLDQIEKWKTKSSKTHITETIKSEIPKLNTWKIMADIKVSSLSWQGIIIPTLTSIRQKNWSEFALAEQLQNQFTELYRVTQALTEFITEWRNIPRQGIFIEKNNELLYQIEKAQQGYFNFWQNLQTKAPKPLRFLTQEFHAFFSQINQELLQVMRYLKAITRALDVLDRAEMARTRLAQNSAGDLMFSLIQLESLVNRSSREKSVFKEWQRQYLEILKANDRKSILQNIQIIDSIHPLLPWFDELVRRDAGFFETPENQRW